MKRLNLIPAIAVILILFGSFVNSSVCRRAGGIEEFNNFKHFDRKENIIHIFIEDFATVKECQLVRWGYEWYGLTEEDIMNTIESIIPTTVFMIDGVDVDGWYFTEVYFFKSYDHDGDGPGDGDGDGWGDIGPNYYWTAFRYSTILSVGEHTWYYEAINPETSGLLIDSGTVIVLPDE